MARYYNSEREIQVGDRVIGHGVADGKCIEGLCGTVRVIFRNGWYEAGVEFDAHMGGHSLNGRCRDGYGYKVMGANLIYAGESTVSAPGNNCIRCDRCGAFFKKSVLGARLFKRLSLCDDCIKYEVGVVHSYHHAKNFTYNVDADKITFGAEIEIDGDGWNFGCDSRDELAHDMVTYARDNNYPLIMSYECDGSLNNGGVECVTAPLTIADYKSDAVKKQLDFLFRRAEELGFNFDAENHAGLHVHIGRKSLCGADAEISNAVGLLMGWAVTRLWNDGFEKLSGRTCTDYTHLYDEERVGKGLTDTPANYDRYHVVNIQNAKTIELRVFNNATCYEDICVAVDVCYMLAKWATKKINAFLKRGSYSAKSKDFTDALAYADRITWDALVKYSKFPEYTLPAMRRAGINV